MARSRAAFNHTDVNLRAGELRLHIFLHKQIAAELQPDRIAVVVWPQFDPSRRAGIRDLFFIDHANNRRLGFVNDRRRPAKRLAQRTRFRYRGMQRCFVADVTLEVNCYAHS